MSVVKKPDAPSILSKTLQVQGDIRSFGVLEIEGKTKGSIRGNVVIIREEGLVEGKIESDAVSIYGSFHGEIKANSISIFKNARLIGNIEYKALSVEDGASIEGQFKKISANNNVTNINDNQNLKIVR